MVARRSVAGHGDASGAMINRIITIGMKLMHMLPAGRSFMRIQPPVKSSKTTYTIIHLHTHDHTRSPANN